MLRSSSGLNTLPAPEYKGRGRGNCTLQSCRAITSTENFSEHPLPVGLALQPFPFLRCQQQVPIPDFTTVQREAARGGHVRVGRTVVSGDLLAGHRFR